MELSNDLLKLTEKEIQVLRRVAEGKTASQIAGELGISPRTVEMRMSNILLELNAKSQAQAVGIGVRVGIIA